jgi:hypothetical protein
MHKTIKTMAGIIAALMIVVLGSLITVEAAVAAPAQSASSAYIRCDFGPLFR